MVIEWLTREKIFIEADKQLLAKDSPSFVIT
jgi:hypothetical protein